MQNFQLKPSDYRTALAAMLHWEAGDQTAAALMMGESAEQDRTVEFTLALLDAHCQIMKAAYRDFNAREVLQRWALDLAAQENGDQE
ncbi:hypothetical protein [Rhodococcus aetherivorans]|uniref:hypothetical protein n=1 Tax=Rhodococcus aetherivorans TaxID=191292 RepID=UPI0002D22E08|nr:hypothetical protein [Rhodococcus aetherivorans]CCW12905.1 hypothetical protein EBESD8_34570 [Rhodococcus aetherivorans]